MGEDCLCKRKYFEVESANERKCIFQKFWEINNFNTQNAYLFGCIHIKTKSRGTKPKESPSRRSHSVDYLITTTGNISYQLSCKKAFLNIYGLQHNRGRIENIGKNIKQGLLMPKMDGRGRHANHKEKLSNESILFLKEFIKRLPKYESHYYRNDNYNTYFMTIDYTIEKCYEVYKIECLSQNQECVSVDKFRRVFTDDFNIKFKSPKSDRCHICDSIYVSMKEATIQSNDKQIQALKLKQELHHRKAKAGQDAIKNATKKNTREQ
ncbi:unnamed protein product [Diabrotica balteata]|uniref:Uncharacterized protein n=1 Tax=Diabrotica balteata TaxID=107213 RepID=A0A9N9SMV2_DIABA|nr:unnamed protein product [Diabrotica balteata]